MQQWSVKIRRLDERGHLWQPTKSSVLCSEHFLKEDFVCQFGRRTVRLGAVPTIFPFAHPAKNRKAPKARDTVLSESTVTPDSSAATASVSTEHAASAMPRDIDVKDVAPLEVVRTFHTYSVQSPTKLRRTNEALRQKLALKMRLLRNGRKREVRLKTKVASLLKELKEKRLLTDQAADLLEAYRDLPLHLFQRRQSGSAFSTEQRQFAATLHYYSAAAYAYVRSKLPSLPNPRTIRRWLAAYDGQPGLTKESFNRIRAANEGVNNTNTYRICALTIDEMEIKKHVDTDRSGKVHGFQDIGCGPMDSDDQPQATKALVVLAIGINAHWKLPLGYLLTNGASADLQVTLLTDVLTELWDCGCTGVSVTFDGLMANQKTLRKLGGSLDPDNLVSCFQHPCNPAVSVAVIFDACHMMKLARNLLNEYQILTIGGTAKAKWKHLELLHDIQQQEGLTLANKLTERHVKYSGQKMKVKLAVQLLSSSCTAALEYLRMNGYPGFEDSIGTEMYLNHLDRLFDILNSRSVFPKGFKSPVSASNVAAKVSALRDTRQFLLTLSDSNCRKLTDTKRRTCVIGFLATIDSLLHLIDTLLMSEHGVNGVRLQYMLTHKFSQDHVEMFFSCIRRRGGWNNNPTALQFVSAYRAVLNRVGAVPSDNGNVTVSAVAQDDVIPSVSPEWLPLEHAEFTSTELDFVDIRFSALSEFVEDVCAYISGFIVRRLLPKVRCSDCRALLTGKAETPDCALIRLKDNGGLIKPSHGVIAIVQRIEMQIRVLMSTDAPAHSISRLGLKLETGVLGDIEPVKLFGHSRHVLETADAIDNHVFLLVRKIVRAYFDLRKHHILRNWNIRQQGRVVRQTLTKTVLFRNQ